MTTTLVLEELSDHEVLETFKIIAKQRYLQMKDFSALGPENMKNDISILKRALNKLKEAELIKEQAAPIDMFNVYYITAKGLYADRLLHRNR